MVIPICQIIHGGCGSYTQFVLSSQIKKEKNNNALPLCQGQLESVVLIFKLCLSGVGRCAANAVAALSERVASFLTTAWVVAWLLLL
jgi:hypothetical protein